MHSIVHTDFAAEDPAALAAFYSAIFGWQSRPMDESGNYVLWSTGEGEQRQGGGFRRFQEGESRAPGARVMVHIEVEDIEAKLDEIRQHGGSQSVGKTEIGGGHGFFALFSDPAGNTVGLWSRH